MSAHTIGGGIESLRKSPRRSCAGIFLCVIKLYIPNNGKDGSDGKKEKSCYKNTSVITFFGLTELALTVVGISLLPCSSHRDKGKYSISKDETDADECPLAADVQQTCKKRHQYACNEESIRENLKIYRRTMHEKTL